MALSIEDQLEIQQLYARYNHFLDYNQPNDWAALFVTDGTFTAPGAIEQIRGTEGLTTFARDVIPQFKARHFNSNLVLDGDGTDAKGTCYMFSWHVPGGGEPKTLQNVGVYVDELARANGRWLFKSRVLNRKSAGRENLRRPARCRCGPFPSSTRMTFLLRQVQHAQMVTVR